MISDKIVPSIITAHSYPLSAILFNSEEIYSNSLVFETSVDPALPLEAFPAVPIVTEILFSVDLPEGPQLSFVNTSMPL